MPARLPKNKTTRKTSRTEEVYAIIDPETGKFWRGDIPHLAAGSMGKPHNSMAKFTPKMRTEPTTWARKDTGLVKLRRYHFLRMAKPELPLLVLQTIKMSPQLIGQEIIVDPEQETKIWGLLFYYYGETVANSFRALNMTAHPEHHSVIRMVGANLGKLSTSAIKTHLPGAFHHGTTLFISKEDEVMVKMLAPKLKVCDLRELTQPKA